MKSFTNIWFEFEIVHQEIVLPLKEKIEEKILEITTIRWNNTHTNTTMTRTLVSKCAQAYFRFLFNFIIS